MNVTGPRPPEPVLPPPLRPGDTIGLFAPGGPIKDRAGIDRGLTILRNHGLNIRVLDNLAPEEGYLAASDAIRAEHLHALWADDTVKAIMAVRGGFGCLRMIDRLDMPFFRAHPKWLIGFSDVTVLLSGVYRQAGLITAHGPVLQTLAESDNESVHSYFALLAGEIPTEITPGALEILRPGMTSGTLIIGNLTTLIHTIGTPWEPIWDHAILCIEDTAEPMYRLDRMLTQLAFSGILERLHGLILGGFYDETIGDSLQSIRFHEKLWQRILELTETFSYPVWGNFPVGHQTKNITLPFGMTVSMDSQRGSLKIQR